LVHKRYRKRNLPLPVVVEFFLNYAEKEEIKTLFDIESVHKISNIFFKQINEWGDRSNYLPVIQNYFSLYFRKYSS
jgi:hypothetical protein